MLLVKTPAGQLALKDRHGGLTPRQRSAFILFDGRRTVGQVLAATAAMGITMDDVQAMIDQGLLESPDGRPLVRPQAAPAAERSAAEPGEVPVPAPAAMAMADRYQGAYRVATELTSGAGLRGFRLNLAVEGRATSRNSPRWPRRSASWSAREKYRRLQDALFG